MSISSKIESLITAANSVTGESRTDLTSAVQDLKDGYGGGTIVLPPEYQKVDYLTSTGTQRIETGVVNDTTGVPVAYEFGVNYHSTSARQLHGSQGSMYVGVVNGRWQCGQGSTTVTSIVATANEWYRVKFCTNPSTASTAKKILVTKPAVDDDFDSATPFTTSDFSPNYKICVFSLNGQVLPSSCSVSYFKVWQGGTLQRHLIPCYRKSDNEIGMYDIVNGVFYTNAGTGNFTCYPAPPTT